MDKKYNLTKEGLEKLKNELEDLKTNGRTEVAEKIKVALSFGDLSENSEYDEAKNEQAILEARIAEITAIIKNAQIIDNENIDNDKVAVGLKVKLLDIEMDEEVVYNIVGSTEANIEENRISDESPLGTALIGKKVGKTVKYDAPCGTLKFKILEISKN